MNNYTQFIQNYGKKYRKAGYQKHHIVPKSKGGTEDKSNIVYLSFAEHAMAHVLYDLETGAKTSTYFRALLASLKGGGEMKPLEEVTLEDFNSITDERNKLNQRSSEIQKAYWADPEKRAFRVSQYSEAKIGKVNVCVGRKWVRKDGQRRRVDPEIVEYYLKEGWELGLGEINRTNRPKHYKKRTN